MNDEIEQMDREIGTVSTAKIAWSFIEDGPMNLIGKEFPLLPHPPFFSEKAGDNERLANRSQFFAELGVDPKSTAVPKLLHGGEVKYVNEHNDFIEDLQCDALVTDAPHLVLTMTFADCPPVVLFDDSARVLAVIHAGWKPIAAGIIENTIDFMRRFGAHPSNISAFIGPGVRKCCYEVGPDVATKVDGLPHQGHVHIDLSTIISMRLVARGVPAEEIEQHPTCTACGVDKEDQKIPLYYSYRREKQADPLNTQMLIASFC